MKTPWINHSKMQEISSDRMIDFKSSPSKVKNISTALNLININEERKGTDKDICELDTAPSGDNINSTNNPPENDDINSLPELHEKKHRYSTYDLYELSDGIDSKHVASVDEFTETANVFKLADSTDCKYDLKTIHADETEDTPQIDFTFEPLHPSDSDVEDEINDLLVTEETDEINPAGRLSAFPRSVQGKVCFITKKSPFSTHVEIDNFLHAPICGEKVQNTFEFLDLNHNQIPQFETKILNNTTHYPEQPNCRLVRSNIHEMIFLTDTHTCGTNNKNQHYKSVAVPLHDSPLRNIHSYTSPDFMHIRVPIVVGEYKIEVCLEEIIVFEEKIMGVKEISKEIVLTNCNFVPTQFSQPLENGTCTALKGNLFIEGYIYQNIEYTTFLNRNADSIQKNSVTHFNQLCQEIVLELIIHLLQVQQVRVSCDGTISKG